MKVLMTAMMVVLFGLSYAQEVRTETYDNGQVKTQYTIFGSYIEVVAYHENGQIKETGAYMNNKPHGDYRQYNEEGELIRSGEYVHGEKQGIWLFKSGEGDLLYQVQYKDNVRVEVNKWVAAEQ